MYDLLILGGGPAGVTAALHARASGASVALVERDRLGGTCTNDGCVPTRVLAKAARLVRSARQFDDYGLEGPLPQINFARLMERTTAIVNAVHEKKQLLDHLTESGVEMYMEGGAARFVDPHTVELEDGMRLQGERILIAVGGHARRLPFPGAEHALTNSDVWQMRTLPTSVAIIGAAATGCQLASVFADFGSEVHLLDLAPRILPGEEVDVSHAIHSAFERRHIDVRTDIGGVERIEKKGNGFALVFKQNKEGDKTEMLDVDGVIMCAGWPGNAESLNPSAAGLELRGSYISIDDYLRTSVPHIFAAGDINGQMMLVQSASHEARMAVENALSNVPLRYHHHIVPHGGFTDPEYGCVGMTEEDARREEDCIVVQIPYADLDRALIDGYTEGFCKLIVARRSRKILGAHIVGEQAVEIAQLVAAAMAGDAHIEDLAGVELAYPTYTAIVGLAARRISAQLRTSYMTPVYYGSTDNNAEPVVAEWERSNGNARTRISNAAD